MEILIVTTIIVVFLLRFIREALDTIGNLNNIALALDDYRHIVPLHL